MRDHGCEESFPCPSNYSGQTLILIIWIVAGTRRARSRLPTALCPTVPGPCHRNRDQARAMAGNMSHGSAFVSPTSLSSRDHSPTASSKVSKEPICGIVCDFHLRAVHLGPQDFSPRARVHLGPALILTLPYTHFGAGSDLSIGIHPRAVRRSMLHRSGTAQIQQNSCETTRSPPRAA